jgi:hypothetical protein
MNDRPMFMRIQRESAVWLMILCCFTMLVAPGCKSPWERVSKLNVTLASYNSSGLEIQVCPRDTKGRVIPIAGSIDIDLWIYDNPRGCSLCERELKQEWLGIQLTDKSYEPQTGASIQLKYVNFTPDAVAICAVGVTLTQDGKSIVCEAIGWDIGSDPTA